MVARLKHMLTIVLCFNFYSEIKDYKLQWVHAAFLLVPFLSFLPPFPFSKEKVITYVSKQVTYTLKTKLTWDSISIFIGLRILS